MIPSECGQLLRACSFYDNRKVTEEAMIAWSHAIGAGIGLRDALEAIAKHYSETSDWIGPSHINKIVQTVRRERLQRAGMPPIPGDLTQAQERAWRVLWCDAVKAGEIDPVATASNAMRLPLELESAPMPVEDLDRLIKNLAEARSVRRAMTAELKPKRKFRWGSWTLGHHDADDNAVFGPGGATALFHDGGPWGIALDEFRTQADLERWVEHIAGKGWGTEQVANDLGRAFQDITA